MKASFSVCAVDSESIERAEIFASKNGFQFSVNPETDFLLEFSETAGVSLLDRRFKKPIKVRVDFTAGALAHRIKYGGGKSQAIAKAVGISAQVKPSVLDATAGLGKDAFVLAALGSGVTMLERSSIAHALLEDGLSRAKIFVAENQDEEIDLLAETLGRLKLINTDSLAYISELKEEAVNVVYLDPMFPERKKSAQVKKEMLIFQELVGKDEDSAQLLNFALSAAENRVVVKRPNHAPFLAESPPSFQLKGKTSRFDIYTKKKLS